jgi:hypothetical protein
LQAKVENIGSIIISWTLKVLCFCLNKLCILVIDYREVPYFKRTEFSVYTELLKPEVVSQDQNHKIIALCFCLNRIYSLWKHCVLHSS